MKRLSYLLILLLVYLTPAHAQQPLVFDLWPDGAPTVSGLTGTEETLAGGRVRKVTGATLTVYRPAKPNGMAIIMCPGGGYVQLAMNHEGHDMAAWMKTQGITYAVLKYRMPNGHHDIPLSDAEQAIRLVRAHAAEWQVNPQQVGIMGASAGGHLAASLATLYTDDSTRPDFQILLYPVISMQQGTTHMGSRNSLLGTAPAAELTERYSLEQRVNGHTPPAFLVLSADDRAVPPANSLNYFTALLAHNVAATMHVYPLGGHGWGFSDGFPYKRQWTEELEKWLRELRAAGQ